MGEEDNKYNQLEEAEGSMITSEDLDLHLYSVALFTVCKIASFNNQCYLNIKTNEGNISGQKSFWKVE